MPCRLKSHSSYAVLINQHTHVKNLVSTTHSYDNNDRFIQNVDHGGLNSDAEISQMVKTQMRRQGKQV